VSSDSIVEIENKNGEVEREGPEEES